MAFNPFSAFQKHRKFWMAAMTLVAMITFVFCGYGGDVSERILRRFQKRGQTVATVGGYNLALEDLHRLRSDRNMVNEFMIKCCHIAADNIGRIMAEDQKKPVPTDPKKKNEYQERLVRLAAMQGTLIEKTRNRYFEGGVKFDDLIEFKTWQVQADRLGVALSPEDVLFLTRMQFFSPPGPDAGFLGYEQMNEAKMLARGFSRELSAAQFEHALLEEFRVRIAKLAMIETQISRFYQNSPNPLVDPNVPDQERVHISLAQVWNVFKEKRAEMDVTLIPIHVADYAKEVFDQKPPTDSDLDKLFEKYRKEKFDPASPFPSFETPEEVKVEFITADPTSPLYAGSARAKLHLETLLPLAGSPLQSTLVAASRAGAFAAAKQKQTEDVMEGLSRPKAFELYRTADLGANGFVWPMAAHFAQNEPRAIASLIANAQASLGVPALPGAQAWAGFLAEASVPSMGKDSTGKDVQIAGHADEIEAGIAAEAKRRTKPYAVVAASGAIGTPGGMAATIFTELKINQFGGMYYSDLMLLPMPVLKRDFEKVLENRTAEQWASRNLFAIKKQLDAASKPEAIKRILNEQLPKKLVTHGVTKGSYNRYNIDQAPELKPLREAYEKYYNQVNWFEKRDIQPEKLLKEGDFYKLFFDTESFAASAPYRPRPWPPDVTPNKMQVRSLPGMHAALEQPNIAPDVLVDVQNKLLSQDTGEVRAYRLIDKAQKPIVFWRTAHTAAEIPATLKAARDKVLEAWKTEQSRDLKAIPLAGKIAEDLRLAGGDYLPSLIQRVTSAGGRASVLIPRVAQLAPKEVGEKFKMGGRREYVPYQLSRDTVALPRTDMVTQLLALYDLKQPIEIKTGHPDGEPAFVKQLNDLNKELFDKAKKDYDKAIKGEKDFRKNAFVQVLTNQPQNIYYVAIITRPPSADPNDFKDSVVAYASEAQFQFRPIDSFLTRAQAMVAHDFHQQLLSELRLEIGYTSNLEGKELQDFDKGADSGG